MTIESDAKRPNPKNSRPGEANGAARLHPFQVCVIRGMSKVWHMSNTDIGRRFGMSREAIRDIVNRRSWPHVAPGTWDSIEHLTVKDLLEVEEPVLQDVVDVFLAGFPAA